MWIEWKPTSIFVRIRRWTRLGRPSTPERDALSSTGNDFPIERRSSAESVEIRSTTSRDRSTSPSDSCSGNLSRSLTASTEYSHTQETIYMPGLSTAGTIPRADPNFETSSVDMDHDQAVFGQMHPKCLMSKSRELLFKEFLLSGRQRGVWSLNVSLQVQEACHLLFSKQSPKKAVQMLSLMIDQVLDQPSQMVAISVLGFCHEFGLGCDADLPKAVEFYRKAVRMQDAFSLSRLIFLKRHGRPGVVIDRVEASSLHEQLKTLTRRVNDELQSSDVMAVNSVMKLLGWLVEAAEEYDLEDAQYCLGICYQDGLGVAVDAERAVNYYRRAASSPTTISSMSFSSSATRGDGDGKIGSNKPSKKSRTLFWSKKRSCHQVEHKSSSKALDEEERDDICQGHAKSQSILGYCYGQGVGVNQDNQRALYWYRRAAAQEDPVAIYNIGYCYEEGLGVIKDDSEAVKCYRRAAEMGNAFAQNSLGYCYEDGIGVDRNPELAVHWHRLSAKQGYPWAQCNLGYCYQNGIGMPDGQKEERRGAKWYYKAAIQGYPRAQHNIGFCLQNGIGVEKNEHAAIEWYKRAAEQGNVFAYHSLGFCYQHGIGVDKNEATAVQWFLKAAEAGHAPAQLSLGYCYRNGVGVDRDDTQVFYWFRRCALGGNAIAQNSLGYCYQEGVGVDADGAEAVAWYTRAARKRYVWAQYNLGRCCMEGIGMNADPSAARQWFLRAANQNLVQAQIKLAQMHEAEATTSTLSSVSSSRLEHDDQSESGEDDMDHQTLSSSEAMKLAMRWYLRAAMNNSPMAQYHVGRLYEHGLGVDAINVNEAIRWYAQAANSGDMQAIERLRALLLTDAIYIEDPTLVLGHTAPAA